jgi:hypothetical protein
MDASGWIIPGRNIIGNYIYQFAVAPIMDNFSPLVTMVLTYDDSLVTNENNLDIYYYNETTQAWMPQNATCDTVANTCTVQTSHFSKWAVIAELADTIPPTATVTYDISTATNHDVVATVTGFSEAVTGLNATGHIFTDNGTFTFTFTDLAGNTGSAIANVTWIDKVAPVITINPYTTTPTNHDVTVTATTNEGTLNSNTHTFTGNSSFDFVATDAAGNNTTQTVTITNIDKIAPVITLNGVTPVTIEVGSIYTDA